MKNIDVEKEKELDKKAKILTFLIILGFIFSVICYIFYPEIISAIICVLGFVWVGKLIFIDIIYSIISDALYKKELRKQEENNEEECVYWY